MIVNGDPGAPNMPDIFTGYPKIAVQFQEKNMLARLDDYFSKDELNKYIDPFVDEGRLSDGGLYVFPLAKSTEILYLNQTLFDKFAEATGADPSKLSTFEGIASLAQDYYKWSQGKQFFAADSLFNLAEVGMVQSGSSIFDNDDNLSLDNDIYTHIFQTIYTPYVEGGFAVYDGYSSDLSKTGDLVCSIGSSAGILFYGNTITYADGTVEDATFNILPYPVFEGGSKTAIQRGGGIMVANSNKIKEYAACEFIKWITAPEQNMQFISQTGYLPVTKAAFDNDMHEHISTVKNECIKKMLNAVMSMYETYDFFTPPNLSNFDELSSSYEDNIFSLFTREHEAFTSNNGPHSYKDALKEFISTN